MNYISTSPRSLIKQVFCQTSRQENLFLFKESFHLYEKYSKLEHLGSLSFFLVHSGYDNDEINESIIDLYSAILITISALKNYANLWDLIPKEVIMNLSKVEGEIKQMPPSFIKK